MSAPTGVVRFLPPEPRDDKQYSAATAATLGDDGWWRIFVQLTLSRGQNQYPQQPILLQFVVRAERDRFCVRVGDSDVTHEVPFDTSEDLQAIYREALERSKEYFASGLQRFLDETADPSPRKIGFT